MSNLKLPVLDSPRVTPQTRRVLQQRLEAPAAPASTLNKEDSLLLGEMIDALLPQQKTGTAVPILQFMKQKLAAGEGAGWRYATLPPAEEAYRRGLAIVRAIRNSAGEADWPALLLRIRNGSLDKDAGFPLSLWFETLRVDAVTAWLAHPATMAAMHYAGYADGEDGWPQPGLAAPPQLSRAKAE